MSHNDDKDRSGSKAYETRDIQVRPLLVFVAGLVVTIIAAYLVVFGVFRLFYAQQATKDMAAGPVAVQRAALSDEQRLPAQPRIQVDPAGEYRLLRQQEEHTLTTYGWVDRPAGLVRIPMDEAMKRIVEEGLPVRQSATAPPVKGTPEPLLPNNATIALPPATAQKK